jgi:hypothetical protein
MITTLIAAVVATHAAPMASGHSQHMAPPGGQMAPMQPNEMEKDCCCKKIGQQEEPVRSEQRKRG